MPAASPTGTKSFSQVRILLIAFALLAVASTAAYFMLFRQDYVVIYKDLRPADASAILAELDKQHVPHQLRDGGAQILVPAKQADAVRLAVVGSGIPTKGVEGFELFDNSDLGLTDFGQKIKFQRALQGELARTIMLTDGVVEARVHISMPDHALFRDDQKQAKAAVTLIMRSPDLATPGRIVGVQRLVAAAIPELTVEDVVVLDGRGEVISAPPIEAPAAAQDATALANAIVRKIVPTKRTAVVIEHVVVKVARPKPAPSGEVGDVAVGALAEGANVRELAPSPSPATRRVIRVSSEAGLTPAEQASIRAAFVSADILESGDTAGLAFEIKPFANDSTAKPAAHDAPSATSVAQVVAAKSSSLSAVSQAPNASSSPATIDWSNVAIAVGVLLVLAIVGAGVVLLSQLASRRGGLAFETQRRLADRLKFDLQSGVQRSASDAS